MASSRRSSSLWQVLQVEHIVVLGHAGCGGIRAFAEQGPPLSPSDSVHRWMSTISQAAARAGSATEEGYLVRLEQAAIDCSLENLMTFPYIDDAVRRGALVLHGAYFDVAAGQVLVRVGSGYVEASALPARLLSAAQ